jgi:hypothetical protein
MAATITSNMDELLSHLSNNTTGIVGPSTWWNKLARAIEEADGEEIWLDLTCQGCARIPAHSSYSSPQQPVPEIVVVQADADDLVSDIGFYSDDRHSSPPPVYSAKAPIVSTTTTTTTSVTPSVAASSSSMAPNERLPHLLIHRKAHAERAAARDHRGRPLHLPLTRSTLLGPRFEGEVKEEEGEDDDDDTQDKQVDGFITAVQSCFRGSNAGQLMILNGGGEAPGMKEAFSSGALRLEDDEHRHFYPPLHPARLGEPSPVEGSFIVTNDKPNRVRSRSRSSRRARMQDQRLLNTQPPTRNSM